MKQSTKQRKAAARHIPQAIGQDLFTQRLVKVVAEGKAAFDNLSFELGRTLAEAIMYMDREQLSGPDYLPSSPNIQKWASQPGSVYIGDQKVKVERPRLRGPEGEIHLKSYEKLKEKGQFSNELFTSVLSGISGRRYQETVEEAANAFGVSKSSISRHIVAATTKKLKEFSERDLSDFIPFAVFIDTIHRSGKAFIVALGIDLEGKKQNLGFWEGATENNEICKELLADLEKRGLALSKKIVFITDGGKGVIKALRETYGKHLIHQRCTIHKDRNIQKHLPKKYRRQAHSYFTKAIALTKYKDAKEELLKLEKWLSEINASAANSLNEAIEEILTVHRLKVPPLLRKTLHSTNPIESMFSIVRDSEKNIKKYKNSKMAQRWLGSILLHGEKKFRKVKGFLQITSVIAEIEKQQKELDQKMSAA